MPTRLIPRYVQIADTLRQRILSGALSPQTRLSSQREMAEEFHTTLATVRQALKVLEEENLIRTEHGTGSFVNRTAVDEHSFSLLGFSDEMSAQALTVQTVLIGLEWQVTHGDASRVLQLNPPSPLICLRRLRLFQNRPIVYQHSYLSNRFSAALQSFQPEESLYHHLRSKAGISITATREILQAILLPQPQAELLQRPAGQPALLSLRVSLDQDSNPVIYDEAWLPSDAFILETERFGLRTAYRFHLLNGHQSDLLSVFFGERMQG